MYSKQVDAGCIHMETMAPYLLAIDRNLAVTDFIVAEDQAFRAGVVPICYDLRVGANNIQAQTPQDIRQMGRHTVAGQTVDREASQKHRDTCRQPARQTAKESVRQPASQTGRQSGEQTDRG